MSPEVSRPCRKMELATSDAAICAEEPSVRHGVRCCNCDKCAAVVTVVTTVQLCNRPQGSSSGTAAQGLARAERRGGAHTGRREAQKGRGGPARKQARGRGEQRRGESRERSRRQGLKATPKKLGRESRSIEHDVMFQTVCCSVLQCVAVCCSVLQCVAVKQVD